MTSLLRQSTWAPASTGRSRSTHEGDSRPSLEALGGRSLSSSSASLAVATILLSPDSSGGSAGLGFQPLRPAANPGLLPPSSLALQPLRRTVSLPLYGGATSLRAKGRWNPCCRCGFSSLPDALIEAEIFAFLDVKSLVAASAVCTRFNFLADAPGLWKKLSFRGGGGHSGGSGVTGSCPKAGSGGTGSGFGSASAAALLAGEGLIPVEDEDDGAGSPPSPSPLFRKSSSSSAGATSFSGPVMCGIGFQRLLMRHREAIESLSMRAVRQDCDLPTRLLAKQPFSKLSTIDLSASKRLSGDAVVALVRAQGKVLNRVILDGVVAIEDSHVKAIASSCRGLKHLSLAGLVLLTDASLEALAHAGTAKQLVTLVLDSCSGITVQGLSRLVKASAVISETDDGESSEEAERDEKQRGDERQEQQQQSRLKVLQARGITGAVTDFFLQTLAECVPKLSILDLSRPAATAGLSGISAEEQELLGGQRSVRPLLGSIGEDEDENDGTDEGEGLKKVEAPRPASYTDLASLAPHQPSFPPPSAVTVTDSGILRLAFSCAGLRVLRLRGYSCVGDSAWKRALSPSSLPQLEEVDLSFCRGIGPKALSALGKAADSTLRQLRLAGCVGASDAALRSAFFSSPSAAKRSRLELLDLHGCRGVVDSRTILDLAKALAKRDPNDEKGEVGIEEGEAEEEEEEQEADFSLDDIESGKLPLPFPRKPSPPSSSPSSSTPTKIDSVGGGGRLIELHVGGLPCLRPLLKPIGDILSPSGPVLGPATAATPPAGKSGGGGGGGRGGGGGQPADPLALLAGILTASGAVQANNEVRAESSSISSGLLAFPPALASAPAASTPSTALAILGSADPVAAAGLFPQGLRVVF